MPNDDIAHKLALLPEGLAEENVQTWQYAIQYYQSRVSHPLLGSRFKYLLDLVQDISKSGQEKLFRAYPSIWMLIISTATPMAEDHGDLFIVIGVQSENLTHAFYSGHKEIIESIDCKSNEITPTLQPLLDRLWNETRGKKNA
jgi:hypothetical protein